MSFDKEHFGETKNVNQERETSLLESVKTKHIFMKILLKAI